jgi:hypothetical protein
MTAKIIPLHARAANRSQALRRMIAVARANGLGPGAVTQQNIDVIARFNLFPEYASSGQALTLREPRYGVYPNKPTVGLRIVQGGTKR